ncbi:hypothetical protein [Spongorhabdus nitratireducens]
MSLELNRAIAIKAMAYVLRTQPDSVDNHPPEGARGSDQSILDDFNQQQNNASPSFLQGKTIIANPTSSLYLALAAYHYLYFHEYQRTLDFGVYGIRNHYFVLLSTPHLAEDEGFDLCESPTTIGAIYPMMPKQIAEIAQTLTPYQTIICDPYLKDVFDTTDTEDCSKRLICGISIEFFRDKGEEEQDDLMSSSFTYRWPLEVIVRSFRFQQWSSLEDTLMNWSIVHATEAYSLTRSITPRVWNFGDIIAGRNT